MKGNINKREKAISFIAPTIILFMIMYLSKLFSGNNLDRLINLIIFVIYSSLFALKREWWNFKKLILATVVITILVFISVVYFNSLINICIIFILIPTLGKTLKHPDYLVYSAIVYLESTIMLLIFIKLEHLEFLALTLIYVVAVLLIRDRKLAVKNSETMEKYIMQLELAHRELQESAVVSMNNAVLGERTRIARDIHDAVGHSLTSIIVQLQAVKYMIRNNPMEAEDTVEGMMKVARKGLEDIRTSVHSLAEDKSSSGVAPIRALASQVEKTTHMKCNFNSEIDNIPLPVSSVLFKVVQEAITNSLKYSEASLIDIDIKVAENNYVLTIADNGRFQGNNISEGFGLSGIRERILELGGKASFEPNSPTGFKIKVEIPN